MEQIEPDATRPVPLEASLAGDISVRPSGLNYNWSQLDDLSLGDDFENGRNPVSLCDD